MNMPQGLACLRFSVAILFQTCLLQIATPLNISEKPENLKRYWAIEEGFSVSLSSFLPTAVLSKGQSALVSPKCLEDSLLVVKDLFNREEWALSSIILI